MVLEGWHVEVIEGFLRELGYYAEIGADEEDDGDGYEYGEVAWGGREIARRVFALLVGGERRRLGLVPLVRDQGHRP
jgi:serine/arginine repetitive matrix protein 2